VVTAGSDRAAYAAVVSFRRLKVLFFLTGATFGCIWPFVALLLLDGGLDAVGIGTVLGASAVMSLIAYPAWGLLADGPLGRERSIAVAGLLAAAIGVFLLAVHHDPFLLGVGIALLPLGFAPWEPVTDAIALQALGEGARAYGRFRLWTSVGWAATSLAGGVVYAVFGGGALLVAFIGGSLVITVVTARPRGGHPGRRSTSRRQPLVPELRRAIVVAPVLVPVLAAVFLEWLGNSAMNGFLPLRIIDVGGGAILVGVAAAVPAIVEAPLFPTTGWISDRLGLRGLYVLGLVMSAGVMLFIAGAQDPVLVAVARAVDGVSYVLRYAGIVLIVGAVLPHALRATGQSLARVVGGGLAAIIAGPFAGAVYEAFGSTALFVACAALTGLGALTAWRGLRGPAFAPGAPVGSIAPIEAGPAEP
jgi:MFS family permease